MRPLKGLHFCPRSNLSAYIPGKGGVSYNRGDMNQSPGAICSKWHLRTRLNTLLEPHIPHLGNVHYLSSGTSHQFLLELERCLTVLQITRLQMYSAAHERGTDSSHRMRRENQRLRPERRWDQEDGHRHERARPSPRQGLLSDSETELHCYPCPRGEKTQALRTVRSSGYRNGTCPVRDPER